MTMEEIQSIVANGDSEQPATLAKNPTEIVDNEANIRDIVNNVQKVLHSEIVNNNFTSSLMHNKLETPDTSSSWSSILPAIFGNTGDSISANKVVATPGNTADSVLMSQTVSTKKPIKHKTPNTSSVLKTTSTPSKATVNKIVKPKPKPSSWSTLSAITATTSAPLKSSTVQHSIKHTSTTKIKQPIKNTLAPITKTTYSKHNTTIIPKPTKLATVQKPSSSLKPTTSYIQKLSSEKITQSPTKVTLAAANVVTTTKKPVSKRPVISSKLPASASKTPSFAYNTSSISTSTNFPSTVENSTKNDQTSDAHTVLQSHTTFITATSPKKKSGTTTLKPKTTKITSSTNVTKLKENLVTSTIKYMTTSTHPTRKAATNPAYTTTIHLAPQKLNPDAVAVIEPEPENIFDSELSLNQIIESLKDLEGTTIPYASNYMGMMDMTTFEIETMPTFDKFDMEPVTVSNSGATANAHLYEEKEAGDFKQTITNNVSYIPQTTVDFTPVPITTQKYNHSNQTHTKPHLNDFSGIEHKESYDDMILDENTTTDQSDVITTTDDPSFSKQSTNMIDILLRESFDSVLSQIKNDNDPPTTVDYNDIETITTVKMNDKKKIVVKPTPFILMEEISNGAAATEPMKYFEAVIKQYEEEKNKTELMNKTVVNSTTTTKYIEPIQAKTTENSFEIETTTELTTSTENRLPELEKLTTQTMKPDTYNLDENVTQTTILPDAEFVTDELIITDVGDITTKVDSTTMEPIEMSTITQTFAHTTLKPIDAVSSKTQIPEIEFSDEEPTTTMKSFDIVESTTEYIEQTTNMMNESAASQIADEKQTQYEMIHLIENIVKNISDDKTNATNLVQRKEDSTESLSIASTVEFNRDDIEFPDLGETIDGGRNKSSVAISVKSSFNKLNSVTLAPILNDLKMKVVNALKNTNTIKLDPAPKQSLGLEESTANAGDDLLEFAKICNEVAFNFWIALNNEGGISSARSLILSPFALTSMMGNFFIIVIFPFHFNFSVI